MFVNVPGVPAAPPVSGLVAAAGRPPPLPEHWENGFAWIPERCGTSYQVVPWCADASNYTAPHPGAAYYRPVGVRIADECSTLNGPADIERVRRVTEAQTPWIVARELWTGSGSAADPYPILPGDGGANVNLALASAHATTVGAGAATALVALGRLEQAAIEASHGQQVWLHVPVLLATQVASNLFRVGQQDYTAAGNPVIFDGGYPGTGPAGQTVGATCWAYATAPVRVALSELDIEDGNTSVASTTNTRTVWTSRVIAASFDPCVHLATQITI